MEIKLTAREMQKVLLKAGLIDEGWEVLSVSRTTTSIPQIKIYLEKKD